MAVSVGCCELPSAEGQSAHRNKNYKFTESKKQVPDNELYKVNSCPGDALAQRTHRLRFLTAGAKPAP